MNISEATQQVEGAIKAYLSKDEFGAYRIPFRMQRPLILMGPPGIGKTAIVAQIAKRMDINFVSYSITHHTRQSALGLPYIDKATFDDRSYRVSRYTMSEIIAAVHDSIERSGVRSGILFLDEINCASETLMPAMLQFLQYKTFGQHRLPAGWVIVCAGNPPEYNRSAREFDPAMMDRMKRIDIEADLEVWLNYAVAHGVHPVITTFLANKPDSFYKVRAVSGGARIVTARGWEDLSRIIYAYDAEKLPVDLNLVSQYIQDQRIAEDFSIYLDLFRKYEDDYKVDEILEKTVSKDIVLRAQNAAFTERLAVVNLLIHALLLEVHAQQRFEQACRGVKRSLQDLQEQLVDVDATALCHRIDDLAHTATSQLAQLKSEGKIDAATLELMSKTAAILNEIRASTNQALIQTGTAVATTQGLFEVIKASFASICKRMATDAQQVSAHVDAALAFVDTAFGSAQEMLVMVSRLSCDHSFMSFVSAHPIEAFTRASKALMFEERGLELLKEARQA